jgi:fatty acid desaturase
MTFGAWRIILGGRDKHGSTYNGIQRIGVAVESTVGPIIAVLLATSFFGLSVGILAWLGVYLVSGALLGTSFQVTHCSLIVDDRLGDRWEPNVGARERLILGTLDTHPSSSVLAVLSGSLNRHVAHHIHPQWSSSGIKAWSIELASLYPRYRYVNSLPLALEAHYRYMKALAKLD